jgi:AcrR family transcriptional regulator
MARRTKAEAEQTRQKIFMAALDLFAQNGFERTTFEDIAARIHLTKGAIYWHFKSKPDLLAELVTDMTAKHNAELASALSKPSSLDELVKHFVERARLIVGKPVNRKYFLMMLRMDWPSAKLDPIKRRLREVKTNPFSVIEDTLAYFQAKGDIRADVDVPTVTLALGALWLGSMKMKIDQCQTTDLEKMVSLGFMAIIDSIRA